MASVVVSDSRDRALVSLLEQRTASAVDFWAFRGTRHRGAAEIYQYPAMMVSPMQGALLEVLCEHLGRPAVVYDAFAGSGTTLTEAMRLGCDFVGTDINPLAVLLCRVRADAVIRTDVREATERVLERARVDRGGLLEDRHWVRKWYRHDVARALSALHRAICAEPDPVCRRVLWVALAEVARTTGNFRISRPKLQTRETDQLGRAIDVPIAFADQAAAIAVERDRHCEELRAAGLLDRQGRYRAAVRLSVGDARSSAWPADLAPAEVILSSPPYGDNHTTMPYGQASFLPLKWIDIDDIDPDCERWLLATSKTLDTHSLGGSRRIDGDRVAATAARSRLLSALLDDLAPAREPWQRVAAFFTDLDAAWEQILANSTSDVHLVLTLGDRTVGGRHVQTIAIVCELLQARGVGVLSSFERPIPHSKRLAPSNQYASTTIAREQVVILRRYSS
ncbi:MAG: DNA methyltransferase [Thermoleophilia bacterium]